MYHWSYAQLEVGQSFIMIAILSCVSLICNQVFSPDEHVRETDEKRLYKREILEIYLTSWREDPHVKKSLKVRDNQSRREYAHKSLYLVFLLVCCNDEMVKKITGISD